MQTSYEEATEWRRYQPYFPAAWRCTPASTPREERWRWRGLDVHLDRLPVPAAPLRILVLHGAGAYGRVMAPAAVLAQRHGYETLAPDLPGYGLTRVPWRRFDYRLWIDCVVELIAAEQARDPRPIVLFGVSLGGILAYQAAARADHIAALIATTLADPTEPEVRRDFARTPLLGSAGLWLLDKLRLVTDNLPLPMPLVSKMDRISNRAELSALCRADRLGGGSWVPARFLRTFMSTPPAIAPEKFDRCPVLLCHPGADRMTDIAHSRRFFDRLAADKRMVILDGASHMPTESPGTEQLAEAVLDLLRSLQSRKEPGEREACT